MRRRYKPLVGLWGLLSLLGANPSQAGLPPEATSAPPRLRVCCALGYDLDLRLAGLRAPVGIQNVVELGGLGQHRYAAHSIFDEKNGQVYTCRGGFIDVAHLRSAADMVAYIYAQILGDHPAGTVSELDLADGRVHITWTRAPTSNAERLIVAQRVSYALTVWHEIVTGQGQGTVSGFSEAFSALSPEDLYSDLWGTQLGVLALNDPRPYDVAAQALTDALLERLGAMPVAHTRRALDQVESRWWDRSVPVPERELLLARNLDFDPPLQPWLVPKPSALLCDSRPPQPADLPHTLPNGAAPDSLYELRIVPPADSPLGSSPRGPEDFESLVKASAQAPMSSPRPRTPKPELAGIHVMGFRAFGGLGYGQDRGAQGGLQVIGAQADGPGGDLSVVRFTAAYDPVERGLIAHFTGIEARNLFFCEEQGGDRMHPPIAAWFQNCVPKGFFGVGGTLAQFQHDGASGRWAMRPLEAHVSFALLENAFSDSFNEEHLVLQTGIAVENAHLPGGPGNFSIRLRSQLQGRWQSDNLRWQAKGHLLLHRDLVDTHDEGAEAGLDLVHRFLLLSGGDNPWAVAELGVHVAYSYWSQPGAALDDVLLPMASASDPHSYRALMTLGFRLERWVF